MSMRAILLAAGRGRRLGKDHPKCLLEVAGKSLLERHFACLPEAGITALTIVVGHQQDQIRDAVTQLAPSLPVEFVVNPQYLFGSLVSLQVSADRLLASGGIWMDADVLYPSKLLRRLVESRHPNCMLLDVRSDESGEEMMVGVRGDRCVKVARRVGEGWDLRGETVGFTKVDAEGGRLMKQTLDVEVAEGRLDQEYEGALDKVFPILPFGFERVDDLPWTEIDFEEDVTKANALVAKITS
jgi:choline kinase